MTSSKHENYLLVAAIDFGTTYSGYAFSSRKDFKRDPTKVYSKQWVDPTSSMMYNKTSTCILFTKEKEFSKFGFDAEAKYLDLMLDEDQENWFFFRRFKMTLYEMQSTNKEVFIEDETGQSMPALIVFTESIKYLKQSLLDDARNQIDIEVNDIKWIITVPAIWSDPAKAFMRMAAVEAGIDTEMLTIALEPEAAACYIKHLPVERRASGKEGDVFQTFSPRSKYVVVDAGGGTIDITAHEVLADDNVKEIIKATGGNWGGTRVDGEYMDFIKCLIGEKTTKEIGENESSIFFEACREFESAKRAIKPQSDITFSVRLPTQIREMYMKTHSGKDLKSVTSVSTKDKQSINIKISGDKLRIAQNDAEYFFAKTIGKITDHLKELFCQENGRDISTIIVVGGFAESTMLIEGMKSAFPRMRIIIPHEAATSVLRGAVIFGQDPCLIRQRRSRYTYGISTWEKFDPNKHDEKYKYEEEGELRCEKLFSKLLEVDELVTVGEYQKEKSFCIRHRGKERTMMLYTSKTENPKYTDEKGCSYIGCIIPSCHSFVPDETIFVKMCFGQTEIEFIAYQPKSNQKAVYYLGQ